MSEDFVTVATFSQPVEAHLARSKLESEGITCFVSEELYNYGGWLFPSAQAKVKLKVPAAEAEMARNVLRPRPRLVVVAGTDNNRSDEDLICPRCRSFEVYYHHMNRRLGAIAIAFLNVVGRSWKRKWICKQCGYEWKDNLGA